MLGSAIHLLRSPSPRSPRRARALATVAVGISGGVDSAVAALLLRQQGHDVVGVHIRSWDEHDETGGEAQGQLGCAERERLDAQRVCAQLQIGFHELDLVKEYWHEACL